MGLATLHIGKLTDGLQYWLHKPLKREMIHQVRVHLKKLRALWLIHPTGNIISFGHSFPALHRLFKKAGFYRDLQTTLLCLETLPGWNPQDKTGQELNEKIHTAKAKIKQDLHKSSFKQKFTDDLHKFQAYYSIASGFLLRSTRTHYRTEANRLMSATDGRMDKQLHDLRIKIKNSLFQCEAFPEKAINTQPIPSNHAYQTLQEQLGKWHDWWFTTNYLQQLHNNPGNPQLENLLEQGEKKTALLKREVMRTLRKHSPKMVDPAVTTMGDKKIIQFPPAKRKTARLQEKSPKIN